MKAINKKKLNEIEIRIDGKGFSVWITEDDGTKHWLVDGSTIKKTGRISIGVCEKYKYNAIIDENNDQVLLIQK